ncbi:MAG: U32 family peptidase [Bacteroides sp.]|nr:U32 family peptidase [Bacteroides sp.]
MKDREIELLAPAKNLECGIEAINHGADAVYIGAPRFGARASATNSLEDIASLIEYAHLFRAKVYVALNTILDKQELREAETMIRDLYRIGADALIIQDMGILQLDLPPIPIHASTQTDNRTPEKVKFLKDCGIQRVVLARELTPEQIREIHKHCDIPLEVFVHGALCVSYSGQCYISQACYGRSANRGECAQFCRLPFNLVDAEGTTIVRNKHLLSLKDMNRIEMLEELIEAGVTSFKIEGRLKDVSYVKNITAAYRSRLDEILQRRPGYRRASSGVSQYTFTPQPDKSFSRGFTPYLPDQKPHDITSFNTPKSLGEEMGSVKEIRRNHFTVAGIKSFHNGDGVCYINEEGIMTGFRINRVEDNKIYPAEMPDIRPRTKLYRNFDQEFERQMLRKSAERKIRVEMELSENPYGYALSLKDEDDIRISLNFPAEKEIARTSQAEQLKKQLTKLGNTPFQVTHFTLNLSDNYFIPASLLSEYRRQAVDKLLQNRKINYRQQLHKIQESSHPYPEKKLTYLGNVRNPEAKRFYLQHGVHEVSPAFEEETPENPVLMFCKHCIRYSMGWCNRYHQQSSPYPEPFYLVTSDNRRFRLKFDCKKCEMRVTNP